MGQRGSGVAGRTMTIIPPLGHGCESQVVTLWTTVWKLSVCGVRRAGSAVEDGGAGSGRGRGAP